MRGGVCNGLCVGVNGRGHRQSRRCCIDWQLAFLICVFDWQLAFCQKPGGLEGPVFSVLCCSVPFCRGSQFNYGGLDWNFWQLSLSVIMINYLSIDLSYPFVSRLGNYVLCWQVIARVLTHKHTDCSSVQHKNKLETELLGIGRTLLLEVACSCRKDQHGKPGS